MKKIISTFLALSMLLSGAGTMAAANDDIELMSSAGIESLGRGLVVQSLGDDKGVYLTWRLQASEDAVFGSAAKNVEFNIYKNGTFLANEKDTTNYVDQTGTSSDVYQVAPVIDGTEGDKCDEVSAFASGSNYFDIPVEKPADVTLADGNTYSYTIGDSSCGDLDGDGEYELVVKWDCHAQDNSKSGYTGNVLLDAYKMDGTKLWRIDLGKNIRGGAHYTQFLVYDFDQDGKAEMTCKTAPGSKDANGDYVTAVSTNNAIKNADNTAEYVNTGGYVLDGDEYFTVFNGETGAAVDTIYYPVQRVNAAVWGDTYGNRCDRFIADVAWLDGEKPYAVYWRGYYFGRNGMQRVGVCGISFDGERLNPKYVFDTYDTENSSYKNSSVSYDNGTYKGVNGFTSGNEIYVGQGNHNMASADVDDDGKDEVMSATLCLEVNDTDKLMPKWCKFKEHGDAYHLGNYDPTTDGMEYFVVHEDGSSEPNEYGTVLDYGMSVYNAKTGEELFHEGASRDTGRGMMANIGAGGYYQIWSSDNAPRVAMGGTDFEYAEWGKPSVNFRIFWDGDLYDELLDETKIDGWNGSGMSRLFTASGCLSINDTKANPALQADLFGDWREEVVYPLSTNDGLRVYTTNIETKYKIKTLMSDRMYRNSVASEQASYNQPPNISMYLSNDTVYGNITNVSLTAPIRKTYIKGQSLDLRGMTLTGTFDTGLSAELEEYEVSRFDSSTAGKKTVTVTSHGYSSSFDVNVVDGANFYSDDFSSYSNSSITMGRQGTANQSQALGSLNLGIGARNDSGDNTSGFAILNDKFGNMLNCISGKYASPARGAYFNFDQCNLPAFADLGNDEILTIDFDARYQDSSSTMEIRGVTSTGSEKASSSNPFRDPYLSVLKNSNIPTGEWINVKLDIRKSKNVTLTITGKGGKVLDTRKFTAKGDAVGNIAFYGFPSQIDISNMSVYTNDVVNGISIASEPTKTEYEKGSTELDLTGLVVNAAYTSGKTRAVGGYTVSGFDGDTVGKQTITVSYNGYTATFDIMVNANVKTVYFSDDFESYTSASITIGKQGEKEQSQDLGNLDLTVGARTSGGDGISGFNLVEDTDNKYLSIVSGKNATSSRGGGIAFDASCGIPAFADIPEGKTLVMSFDAYYKDASSTLQVMGVTSSETSKGGQVVSDPYLSVANNAKLPTGEWFNISLSISSDKNVVLTVTNSAGEVLDTQTFTACGNSIEKIAFYGGATVVNIDNLKVYTLGKELTGISITTKPTKLIYKLGESLDLTGMVVTAVYSDTTTGTVSEYLTSGYDANTVGKQTVTVKYSGQTATFDVTVIGIKGISVTTKPTKVTYKKGENLDLTGMVVTAEYTDGTNVAVTGYTTSGYNANKSGKQTITVTYSGKTATVDITVEKSLTGISVTTKPTKVTYKKGESLDLTGMVVTASYDDNSSEAVTGYTTSGFDTNTIGTQTVTVAYGGQNATFEVTVKNIKVEIKVAQNGLNFANGILSGSLTANIANNSGDAYILFAVYDENGILTQIKYQKVADENTSEFSNVKAENLTENYSCKLFAWKDLKNVKPICGEYKVK